MTRQELSDMIDLAERLAGANEPGVVATLFASNGSTYRPLGSMMISGPGSMIAGGVSGGCLEHYIARHGRALTLEQPAAMLSFDADPDGADDGKPVLGCGGSIEVLVERLTGAHISFLRKFHDSVATDTAATAFCLVDISSPSLSTDRCWFEDQFPRGVDRPLQRLRLQALAEGKSRHGTLDPTRRALVHYIPPLTRLVILGAGDDARPLCALARSLGWHVTVADRRGRLATHGRFPEADAVMSADWPAIVGQTIFTPQTAVVLMTHSLPDDVEILPLLAEKQIAYVGALGPAHRRCWLLEGVKETAGISPAFAERVRGPIGLNLGDRSAAGIAVSIVSEILAEMNGRSPAALSPPPRRSFSVPATAYGVAHA